MAVLVSPGINISEIDQTTSTPTVSTTIGALAGIFGWGPVGKVSLVSGTEDKLVKKYGKPDNSTYETFFTAANFMAYGGSLYISRAGVTSGSSSNYATSLSGNTTVLISSNTTSVVAGQSVYGDKVNYGTKVVSSSANNTHTIILLTSNALSGNSTVADVQTLNYYASDRMYNAFANSANIVDRSSVLIKNEDEFNNVSIPAGVEFVAKYPSSLGNSLKVSVCASPSQFSSTIDPFNISGYTNNTVIPSIGGISLNVNSSTANVYIANSVTLSFANTYTAANSLKNSLTVGDYIEVGNSSIGIQSIKIRSIGNLSNTNPLSPTGQVYFNLELEQPYSRSTNYTANTISRKWEFFNLASSIPKVSFTAQQAGSSQVDEISIVVTDEDGLFSGTSGTVLEVFPNLSRGINAKDTEGSSIYYKNIINTTSSYLWAGNDISGIPTGLLSGLTTPTVTNVYNKSFIGGESGPSESEISFGTLAQSIDLFKSKTNFDISLVMAGKSLGLDGVQSINYLIDNISSFRKDCVVFYSPPKTSIVSVTDQATKLVTFNNNVRKGSYAFGDANYKYQYDKYNDVFRWVPFNGDVAGLSVRTDSDRDPWYSIAGFNRGQIKNVTKLAFNPDDTETTLLFANFINPIVNFQDGGTILYGDKTNTGFKQAFTELGIRKLFISLEKTIGIAARRLLFEFNDDFTRSQFRNLVEPTLRDVQGRNGLERFKVVADESNNTSAVIDSNRFVGDIYIVPKHSIHTIQLNFIASGSSVEFNVITNS
jgi:Phage tail sheath protein subtilisin-like domain/Phage tail sheath C-terminal domain